MQRRTFVTLAAVSTATLAMPVVTGTALGRQDNTDRDGTDQQGQGANGGLDAALRRFLALPGTKSFLIHVGQGGALRRIAYQPGLFLFTASAYKTFVLCQYLRDVEAGRLSEDKSGAINSTRTLGSPVFGDLAGETTARSVLEGMVGHSDNMAIDIATENVGADRVRELIAEAGLSSIRIPDSTRRFLSYILGAPAGVDLGWPGIANAVRNPPGPLRSPLNDVITSAGNAHDFVSWYEQALQGRFFAMRESLTEFKRIQAMSAQIAKAVPPDTLAYAKGGKLPWPGLSTKSFAGQIVVGGDGCTPVTFCFIVNWNGPESEFPAVESEFFAAIKGILRVIKRDLR